MKTPVVKDFRTWAQEIWFQNCEEHDMYYLPRYTQQEYFHQYKWWLRARYQQLRRQGLV